MAHDFSMMVPGGVLAGKASVRSPDRESAVRVLPRWLLVGASGAGRSWGACEHPLNWIHERLRPGGTAIVADFDVANPSKAVMDHLLDWKLIHRTA
jgi:hypothetical protein